MAANTHLSVVAWNAALNAILDPLNGGFIDGYNGVQPSTPDTPVTSQTKLFRASLGTPAFNPAQAGSKIAMTISGGAGIVSGTCTWFRAVAADGTTAILDGSAGTSSSDLILYDSNILAGGNIPVASWVVSMPAGQ